MKICICLETDTNKNLLPACFQLISKAKAITDTEAEIIGISAQNFDNKYVQELYEYGLTRLITANNEELEEYSANLYAEVFVQIIKKENPDIVLIPATDNGREIAPLIATTLKTGLTADCTELRIEDGKLYATRPTFGGKLFATILCRNNPQMATIRPNVFKAVKLMEINSFVNFKPEYFTADLNNIKSFTKILEFIKTENQEKFSVDNPNIVVAGGKGMKSKEGFEILYELAKELNAGVGASRPAVEEGFAPQSAQVGQTGKTISAKIYIACGISGASQHLSGINSCDTIIAINKNPSAPIFQTADIGIVGDCAEVIPKLIEFIKERKKYKEEQNG